MHDITDGSVPLDPIDAVQVVTRDLVGVALRSLDILDGAVSLAQFRLLVALDELGCTPSSRVAGFLGLGPSSVSRLADRLVESGHVRRGGDPANRSVVTLELTGAGRALVGAVLDHRRAELGRVLDRLTPAQRDGLAESLRLLHTAIGAEAPTGVTAPVEAGAVPL